MVQTRDGLGQTTPDDWERVDPHVRPDLTRCALLTVDAQVDFLEGGACPLPGTDQVLSAISLLVAAFRSAARPIVHAVRLYVGGDVDLVRRTMIESGKSIVRPGTPGSQIAAALRRDIFPDLDTDRLLAGDVQRLGSSEVVIWKPRWSAFYRTTLHEHLANINVDTLVVAGFNYANCPRATITDATARDYRVVIPVDAISGIRSLHIEEAAAIGAVPAASAAIATLLRTVWRPERSVRDLE